MQRIFLIATLFTLAAWSADGAEVCLRPEANCSGAIVRLKDVAEVAATDENEAAALAELQLFPVPSTGKLRHVRRGEIRELLSLSGVNVQAVSFGGAEQVVVRRSSANLVEKQPMTGETLPTAFITPSTKLAGSKQPAGVELVPVATRALERGTILRAADLEMRPLATSTGRASLKIEDLVGQEMLRAIPAGQQVVAEFAQSPRVVHRNGKVKIRAVAAGVVVTTDGKALAEGGLGDNILVEDFATKEKIMTRVTGFERVEVLGTGVTKVR